MKQDFVQIPIMFWLKFKEELSDVWKLIDNYKNVEEVNVVKTKRETLILENGWRQVKVNNEVMEDKEVYFRYLGDSYFHISFNKIDEEEAAKKVELEPKKPKNLGNSSNVPKTGHHSKGKTPALFVPPKRRSAKSL